LMAVASVPTTKSSSEICVQGSSMQIHVQQVQSLDVVQTRIVLARFQAQKSDFLMPVLKFMVKIVNILQT